MIKNQKQQNVEIYKEILHNQIKTENYIKEQNKESNIHKIYVVFFFFFNLFFVKGSNWNDDFKTLKM